MKLGMFAFRVVRSIVVVGMHSHVMEYLLTNYMYAESTRLLYSRVYTADGKSMIESVHAEKKEIISC